MDNRDNKKLINAEFKDIREEFNFFHLSDAQIVKLTSKNVLDVISFDLANFGITCWVAIYPLYMLDINPGVISLSMGARLSRFKTFLPEWWESGDIESNLEEIKSLLLKNGMPWFEKYGSPEGIIAFIKKGKPKEYDLHFFQSHTQTEYLGFSLLYIGRINEGLRTLEGLVNEPISPYASSTWKKYIQDLSNLLDTMKRNPADTPAILEKLIAENKKALKINV